MKLFTIILFAITYILMIALPKKRPYVALISAVIFGRLRARCRSDLSSRPSTGTSF